MYRQTVRERGGGRISSTGLKKNDATTTTSTTATIQCVSVDSASLIIYPEIKATEVTFSALKRYLCSFYFRIDNEESTETHCIASYWKKKQELRRHRRCTKAKMDRLTSIRKKKVFFFHVLCEENI